MEACPSKAEIIVMSGPGFGRKFFLEGSRITVGRSSRCDIAIPARGVSRQQLVLEQNARGRWTLVDQDSKNGIAVNSKRVERHVLKDNDRIRLGANTVLLFRCEEPPAEDSSAAELSAEDVARCATELDATIELANFLKWLRENRQDLHTLSADEVESVARQCLYEFAHMPHAAGDPATSA